MNLPYCHISGRRDQLALDRYELKKYFDEKLASSTTPSQLRYSPVAMDKQRALLDAAYDYASVDDT